MLTHGLGNIALFFIPVSKIPKIGKTAKVAEEVSKIEKGVEAVGKVSLAEKEAKGIRSLFKVEKEAEAVEGLTKANRSVREAEKVAEGRLDALLKADSKVLRQNLINAGVEVPDYANAAESRAILQKFGVDINEAANGVFLPTVKEVVESAYHPSLHTNVYYNEINKQLLKATSKDDVLSILDDIAEQLLDGTFMK